MKETVITAKSTGTIIARNAFTLILDLYSKESHMKKDGRKLSRMYGFNEISAKTDRIRVKREMKKFFLTINSFQLL
jgi:hypothetical protein